MSSLLSLQEENRILQQELSRLEDLLAQSRAERDELAIKYNAISERVGRLPARPHKSTRFGPKTHLPSVSGSFCWRRAVPGCAGCAQRPGDGDVGAWRAGTCPVGRTKHPHTTPVAFTPLPSFLHRGNRGRTRLLAGRPLPGEMQNLAGAR